jgi:hypothetical protein
MIHLHHAGQPDFARRRLGTTFFVHEPGEVLGFKAGDPDINADFRGAESTHIPHYQPQRFQGIQMLCVRGFSAREARKPHSY